MNFRRQNSPLPLSTRIQPFARWIIWTGLAAVAAMATPRIAQAGTLQLTGNTTSISGITGLTGRYLYRDLDTATGAVSPNASLKASDDTGSDEFGAYSSLSGNMALVGASYATVSTNVEQGAAYLYRNLDTATGNVTQSVKLTAGDGVDHSYFGSAVSLSGNIGLIGAYYAPSASTDFQVRLISSAIWIPPWVQSRTLCTTTQS